MAEDQINTTRQVVGPYKIISRLGVGGMGEVFLGEDSRLGRKVALKVLPDCVASDKERLGRFNREARAASALNHPNVATIYEFGEADGLSYIAMEYVEGQTLSSRIKGQPITPAEIVEISEQVADALDEAHTKGITHRDVKSANIMLTARGHVKVLDFGLAKMRPEGSPGELSQMTTAAATEPGLVMGTVQYMSPEQALGRDVDQRSDIFSLGVVMYEMATGRLPFSGATGPETIEQIAHQQPAAIARFNYEVTGELERIIRKCLEKDRERRYQSARDLLVDLRNLKRDREPGDITPGGVDSQGATRAKRIATSVALSALVLAAFALYYFVFRTQPTNKPILSLAILPLTNVGADANAEYLCDGITESLINSLSQLSRLKVMARTTAFRYKGKDIDPQVIGRDLNVDAIVTGRVIQQGDTLVVQADLLKTADGSQLWGERYNRKLSDILAVQDEIARQISQKLRVRLTGEVDSFLDKQYTRDTEAYQLYLKGRFWWNKRSAEAINKGVEYFHQAIERDPAFALAYAGLADSYNLLTELGGAPKEETYPKARTAAARALEIDEGLSEAHTSLGYCLMNYYKDWAAAEREFKRAIELNPNYPTVHQWYSEYLASVGRLDESLSEIRYALQLDPLSLPINARLGLTLYFRREYDQAIEQLRKTLEMDPGFGLAHIFLYLNYAQKGTYERAIPEKAIAMSEGNPERAAKLEAELMRAFKEAGERAMWQRQISLVERESKLSFDDQFWMTEAYSRLNNQDKTFECLSNAVEAGHPSTFNLKVDPLFDPLRADRRFAALLRRVGLTP